MRVYRRVCILRSEGRSGEAQRIEDTEFAAAADQARGALGAGPGAEARLEALLAGERERVAEAVAFAEILAPMLSARLRAPGTAGPPAAESPLPARPGARRPAEARAVADFIEEMLAQDRAGAR